MPTPCAEGTYQTDTGAVDCVPAPAGTYVNRLGQVAATPCGFGTFQAQTGAIACEPAPANTYVDTVGAVTATPCPAGTVQPLTGQSACYTAAVTAGATGVNTQPGGTATAATDSVTATATGTGAIAVAIYASNPGAAPAFATGGPYFDVKVLPGSTFTTVSVQDCNLQGADDVLWWNGSAWSPVSDQTFDGATGCVTLAFGPATSPSLAQLGGTPFAGAIAPPEATLTVSPPSEAGHPRLQVSSPGATVSPPSCQARADDRHGSQVCTYVVTATPQATLTLRVRVQADGDHLTASVVNLTYVSGASVKHVTPADNAEAFSWSFDRSGHIRQLDELVRAGRLRSAAHFDGASNVTRIGGPGHGSDPGLVLLTLTTHSGQLVIGNASQTESGGGAPPPSEPRGDQDPGRLPAGPVALTPGA